MKQEITILTTWKGIIYEIDMAYEDFLQMELDLKNQGEDGFNSSKYREFIKFASIENKKGKTKHLLLEAPTKEFVEQTPEQRAEFEEFQRKILTDTFEGRKKRFHIKRQEILEQLARDEKRFGLETTLEKLSNYNILKLTKIKG